MSAKVDKFCKDLRDRLNAIEVRVESAKANGLLACQGIKVALHGGRGLFPIHTPCLSPHPGRKQTIARRNSLSTRRAKQGDASLIPTTIHAGRSDWRAVMYQIQIYSITRNLWRWEVRYGGVLLCCGTARTRRAAENEANQNVNV